MNAARNVLADLVEKRLWPVAVLLVALLVAVPMTLAKPGEPTEVASQPTVEQKDADRPELNLTRTSTTGFQRAPRVNDDRLDPFGRRGRAKATEKAAGELADAADDVIDSSTGGGGSEGGGGGGGGGGDTPNSTPKPPKGDDPQDDPDPTTPEVKTEEDDVIAVLVQTATPSETEESDAKELEDVRTLTPLPDTANPFLVYMGRAENADKAMFLVSADVKVTLAGGRGTCAPSVDDCRTLILAVGDTATFTPTTGTDVKPISITLTDIEKKDVPVADGTEETETAADAELAARAIGAKALKSVLRDDDVVNQLVRAKVKIRK